MSNFHNEHVMRWHWETLKKRHFEFVAKNKPVSQSGDGGNDESN
ncbi:hypothetical protein O3W44_00265 [Pantoea sp. LMR881]|nr:anticodon nuclease activator Stp [Pantoea sp. LMR881]MCZ4057837.1 hypothetical protein [Pantoea sp. LMR881]